MKEVTSQKEITHYKTDQIVCPYCGKVDNDGHNFGYGGLTIQCKKCNEKFIADMHIETTYTTIKIDI